VSKELAAGAYSAVVVPWNEAASRWHLEHPGRSYVQGEVRMPRQDVRVTADHDGPVVGTAGSFSVTAAGMQGVIKLGRRGEELLRQGFRALSPEIDELTGELIGIALAVTAEPAFRPARILVGGPADHVVTMASSALPLSVDIGAARRELFAEGMSPVFAGVVRDRERWQLRQEELRQEPVEREEQLLIAEGRPVPLWPRHLPRRQQFADLEARLDGEKAARVTTLGIRAGLEWSQRMKRLEAQAERRWWRRGK
jgi:hypothetical protein